MISTALILALLSAGSDVDCGRQGDRCPDGSNRSKGGLAWFEFAPTSGAGLPSAANLCDTLTAAEKASVMPDGGSGFWCLNGDATMDPASTISIVAPTDAGTTLPSPVTMRVCPNGPDCGSKSALEFSATLDTDQQGYRQTSTSNPLGANDWTLCQHLQFGADWATASYENTVFHGVGAGIDVLFQRQAGTGSWNVYSSGIARGSGTVNFGAPAIMCATRVDSSQRIRTYFNGTVNYDTSSTGSCAGTTSIWKVGGYDTASAFPIKKGTRVFGTFFVNTALSDARIAAIARAVLADAPTGAKGEALSETRASVQFCESSDGTGSLLPNNRLCVTRGGTTAAQGSFVQQQVRTEELDNAAWTNQATGVAVPTLNSANAAVSPGGTLTAEDYTFPATNAGQLSARHGGSIVACAGTACTFSIWAQGQSGSGTIDLCAWDTMTPTCGPCSFTSTGPVRCSYTATRTGNVAISIGNQTQYNGGTTRPQNRVYLWGANVTTGSSLRPYIPATSAGVTTAAEVPYLTLTNAPALNSIEATIDTPASFPGTTPRVWGLTKDANNIMDAYIDIAGGNKLGCFWYVGGVSYTAKSAGAVPTSTLGVRLSCSYSGGNGIACVNGSCTSTALAFTNFSGATKMYVGAYGLGTTYEIGPMPVIKSVKADNNSARFR